MRLTNSLPALAEQSPVMRFMRMDDPSHPSWAITHADLWRSLLNLDTSVSFYDGKTNGFAIPQGAVWTWRVRVDNASAVIDCKLTDSHAYCFAFESLKPGKDGHPHPVRAFRLRRRAWDRFIDQAFNILELNRFPDALPLGEFKRRVVVKGAPLRCVPKRAHNAPILFTVDDKEMFVSKAFHPNEESLWCQVRLYSAVYWLESVYVVDKRV